MIRFNILALLEQKKKTRYWLAKQMGMSHQNLSRIVNNETNSIHLETLETLCQVLECTPSDLFVIDPDLPEGTVSSTPPVPEEKSSTDQPL